MVHLAKIGKQVNFGTELVLELRNRGVVRMKGLDMPLDVFAVICIPPVTNLVQILIISEFSKQITGFNDGCRCKGVQFDGFGRMLSFGYLFGRNRQK